MNIRNFISVSERRKALEKELNVDLKNIGSFTLDETVVSTRNCENMIGVAQVPIGIAGPLKIAKKEYYIPLATTEGALVASVSRGCKSITESGGAFVRGKRVGATRGPVFRVDSMEKQVELSSFLKTNIDELKQIAKSTSAHVQLIRFNSRAVGKYRFVRFFFDTQDAMGMNMATIATEAIVRFIEKKTGTECISLAGNFDTDKKPAWINVIENRGFKVWAEVVLTNNILKNILKTSAKKVYDVWMAKCMIGSAMSGSMGFNAQYANIIAAMFLATGQDLGHVGEGSIGITTCEIEGNDLYVSVYLPDLMVGTVGGGTGLATQKEALAILGVTKVEQFAEIVGAAVLAGEISLLASLSEGTLARAHQTLARGKIKNSEPRTQ